MVRFSVDLNDTAVIDTAAEILLKRKDLVKKRKVLTAVLAVCGLVEIILGLCVWPGVLSVFALAVGILFLLFAIKAKAYQRYMLKRSQRKAAETLRGSKAEYSVGPEGVEINSLLGHSESEWSAFKEYGTLGQYIFMIRKDDTMILADRNTLSDDEITELTQLLSEHIKKEDLS